MPYNGIEKKEKYMARFVLLYLKTSGLKSLDHDIELQFYNHDLSTFSYNSSLIKAIYGTNGEGKTAIAHTLELYKNSVVNGEYLAAQSFSGALQGLINQKTQKVSIDLYFALFLSEKKYDIVHHIIEYKLVDNRVYVSHELISKCNGTSWGNIDNEDIIFETREGEFTFIYPKLDEETKEEIKDKTRNLLSNGSCVFSVVVNSIISNHPSPKKKAAAFQTMDLIAKRIILFCLFMNIYIDKDDRVNVSTERVESKVGSGLAYSIQIGDGEDVVSIEKENEYRKQIKRIEDMIKVFKPDLDYIDLKFADARGAKLIFKKTFIYKNGDKIDLAYESTGIKKLVRIFGALSAVDDGGVVFIDEFDANIHDVYLCKLIEYFSEFTNGQLIFTTHNLGPMEVLDKKGAKHSIDFINKKKVTPWRRNGNYSVVNVYRKGMIPNSPFNIESVDFIRVLGGGKR